MEFLQLALRASIPLIHVQTDDLLNVEQILTHLAGEPVKPLQVPVAIDKLSDCKFPDKGRVFFTSGECKTLIKLYHHCADNGKTIVFINTEKSVLHFDGQHLVTPKELIVELLKEATDSPEEFVPAFAGLTLKDIKEMADITMTRDEELTIRGVATTRRSYTTLKGIQQVDTNIGYYLCPSELGKWMNENRKFFKENQHKVLMPKGLLLDGPPGCLAGFTNLLYLRGNRNSGRPIKLENLYRRFNGIPDGRNMPRGDRPTYLHSMQEDGSIKYNRIVSIIESGVKPVLTIVSKLGNSLTLTYDHPVCLTSGEFIPAGNLTVGSKVRIKGSMIPTGTSGKKKREIHRREICVKNHPIAGIKIVEGHVYKRLHFSRIVIEAHMNKLEVFDYVKLLNDNKLENLVFLESSQEVHHIDENVKNDTLSNLVVMSKSDHAKHHSSSRNFKVDYTADDEIIEILDAGSTMTYDVQMNMPCHNFVADNFIVHNTGKTLASKYIASELGVPLYRLDLSAMMGKYVGSSEDALNAALAQIDAVAPNVVLLDEVEKVFQSQSDSGVTARLLSQLLWWLNESTGQTIVIMTTNDMTRIPRELYREGRIDKVMQFNGIDNIQDAQEFAISVAHQTALEVGLVIDSDATKRLTTKVKMLFQDDEAVPQSRLSQEAFNIVREVSTGE